MTDLRDLFLGLIALAVLVIAAVQIGFVVYAARVARRVDRLLGRIDRDLEPLMRRLRELGEDAGRASTLAIAQLERADQVFADAAVRIEAMLADIQRLAGGPAREGAALLAGVRAALAALRARRQQRPVRDAEGEEALFIG